MDVSRREFVSLVSSALAVLASPTLRAQTPRVRREIRSLTTADVNVLKAGIEAMRALPKVDFRSWLYQQGVHWASADESAGVPDAGTYWNQCVHGGLHFLSWHRWELLFIEEIVRLISGQCTFTLPYWDYIENGFLPDALRVAADSSNPLFDETRAVALNDGSGSLSGLNTSALTNTAFGPFSSSVYGNPHSAVHGLVGGNMGFVPTAARDPVFYLHHCNIDRYWECWLRMGEGRANPGDPWPQRTFPFRSVTGQRNIVVGDGGRTADLGYTYDNLPCRRFVRPDVLDWIRDLELVRVRVRPPRPIPDPWPWQPVVAFEGIRLSSRPTGVVLPRRNLQTFTGRGAIVLHEVEATEFAKKGGFFIEVWLAPSSRELERGNSEGVVQVGSFSTFDLADHSGTHDKRGMAAPLVFELSEDTQRAFSARTGDPVVVFVWRGLVDKAGTALPYDQKAELLRVGALRIESAR